MDDLFMWLAFIGVSAVVILFAFAAFDRSRAANDNRGEYTLIFAVVGTAFVAVAVLVFTVIGGYRV